MSTVYEAIDERLNSLVAPKETFVSTVITVIEKGAQVRVLSVSDDNRWYEVEAPASEGPGGGVIAWIDG